MAHTPFVDGYWTTPDDDPRRLYHNVLVALDEERGLNTGEPGLWARFFDRLGIARGSRILQIGTGSGYFTAILAELAGPDGQVEGFEVDEPLAAAAQRNLAPWPAAHVRAADASQPIDGHGMSSWPSPAPPRRTPGGWMRWPMVAACCCR